MSGHDWSEWVVIAAPSCLTAGMQTRVCQRNAAHSENQIIPALGHDDGEWHIVMEADCLTSGLKELRCTRCATVLDTEMPPALGHGFGEWTQTTAPDCTTDGVDSRDCTRCGEIETRVGAPALGHDKGVWHTVIATETWIRELRCTVCNTATVSHTIVAPVFGMGNWNGAAWQWPTSNGVRTGLPFMEFGEYPRIYVGNAFNTTLEGLHAMGSLNRTGRSFTGNSLDGLSGDFVPRVNYEYYHEGSRFVRVGIISFNATQPFSTGTNNGATGTVRWMRVEPIRWLVGNWAQLPRSINPGGPLTGAATTINLVAADIITAGIPFGKNYTTLWENSVMREFLNASFLQEAFTIAKQSLIGVSILPNSLPNTAAFVYDGTPTQDRVFLPSRFDAEHTEGMFNSVFGGDVMREGKVTDFAIANNAARGNVFSIGDNVGMGWWMTRTVRGSDANHLVTRFSGRGRPTVGETQTAFWSGVRPAFTITL